jgi:hypothetical protein
LAEPAPGLGAVDAPAPTFDGELPNADGADVETTAVSKLDASSVDRSGAAGATTGSLATVA